MKVNKTKIFPLNDRIAKNKLKQKLIYESYDIKNKQLLSKENLQKIKRITPKLVNNMKNIHDKKDNHNNINIQNIVTKQNVLKKIPEVYFNKINSLNFKITQEDVLKFEKNEEHIYNNLLKGIEQLNNGHYIINSNYVLQKKYLKEKQSIMTKEGETMYNSDKNINISKSLGTNKTLSKRNSKEKSSKKKQKEINNVNGKRVIKILFPINPNDSKINYFNKELSIRLKNKKELKQNNEESNFFPSYYTNNKKEIEDISLWDISSIKSNPNSYRTNNSKYNINIQNSLYDFI